MSRTLTTDVGNALQDSHKKLCTFVEMEFSSGSVRVTNAPHNIAWNSYTWTGLGRLGAISPIEEAGQLQARSITLQLSGIPAAMISIAMGEHYQGREVNLWLGAFNLTTGALLADPVGPITYLIDTMTIALGETATIELTAHSRLSDWDRPRLKHFNDADQQTDYDGDLFCQFAEEMVEKILIW